MYAHKVSHTPNKQFQLDFRRNEPPVLHNPVRGKSTTSRSLTGTMCSASASPLPWCCTSFFANVSCLLVHIVRSWASDIDHAVLRLLPFMSSPSPPPRNALVWKVSRPLTRHPLIRLALAQCKSLSIVCNACSSSQWITHSVIHIYCWRTPLSTSFLCSTASCI